MVHIAQITIYSRKHLLVSYHEISPIKLTSKCLYNILSRIFFLFYKIETLVIAPVIYIFLQILNAYEDLQILYAYDSHARSLFNLVEEIAVPNRAFIVWCPLCFFPKK